VQEAVPAVVPAARVHVVDVKVPVLFVVNVTVPVGVVGAEEVSVTVAAQVVLVPTVTELDAQTTEVVVVRRRAGVAARRNVPLLVE
jgi:hypothetical protein